MKPAGLIVPAQPIRAAVPPSGPDWLHEIKHDGFRIIAQRDGERVRLITRGGHNWADRYPLITAALQALAVGSCTIDGEAIVCDENGIADFQLLRHRRHDQTVTLCAFDLLELDGRDLRSDPIEHRKAALTELLARCRPGLVINWVFDKPGDEVFKHACALGCEGIVSKRRGSRYVSGRTDHWRKVKNPAAPAVSRGAEEVCSDTGIGMAPQSMDFPGLQQAVRGRTESDCPKVSLESCLDADQR